MKGENEVEESTGCVCVRDRRGEGEEREAALCGHTYTGFIVFTVQHRSRGSVHWLWQKKWVCAKKRERLRQTESKEEESLIMTFGC